MAAFTVLTGKKLSAAIKGYGAKAETFAKLTHQLAYSALRHVEDHHCASHLNALFAATPTNYRNTLRIWAKDLGKVTFDAEAQAFAYAKDASSDMDKALDVSPAEYAREKKQGAETDFDEVRAIETFLKKMREKGGSPAAISAIEGALRIAKGDNVTAIPAPAERKVTKKAA